MQNSPKWRIFAQSGHTADWIRLQICRSLAINFCLETANWNSAFAINNNNNIINNNNNNINNNIINNNNIIKCCHEEEDYFCKIVKVLICFCWIRFDDSKGNKGKRSQINF